MQYMIYLSSVNTFLSVRVNAIDREIQSQIQISRFVRYDGSITLHSLLHFPPLFPFDLLLSIIPSEAEESLFVTILRSNRIILIGWLWKTSLRDNKISPSFRVCEIVSIPEWGNAARFRKRNSKQDISLTFDMTKKSESSTDSHRETYVAFLSPLSPISSYS